MCYIIYIRNYSVIKDVEQKSARYFKELKYCHSACVGICVIFFNTNIISYYKYLATLYFVFELDKLCTVHNKSTYNIKFNILHR